MSKNKASHSQPKSLAKGLLAGLIGGVVGVLAMAATERLAALRARKTVGPAELPESSALDPMHWSFGLAVGAAYGAAAEYFPSATANKGAAFGMALETFAQEGTLPAIGLLTGSANAKTASKTTSHVVYGITTETVRGLVRKHL